MTPQSVARDVFLVGVKNAHAMEKQALSIMEPQVQRLEHYPEVSRKLQQHISETNDQIERLNKILADAGHSPSSMKDAFLSAMGGMASMGHMPAGDEVLKNSFANYAFENYEIAAYIGLIASANMAGESAAVPVLQQSLGEEQQMARWIQEHLSEVTQAFISRSASGTRADV
ncbi:ferritin-like domain-containing protein [Rhodobacteraceae bacterium MCCB 386]|nr:ferritin-like domain-containing protein [Roseitranquillus sediminis]